MAQLRVSGDVVTVKALTHFQAAMVHVLRGELTNRPLLGSWSALLNYLRVTMAFDQIERLRVLHLNTRNILIADEIMFYGSIDECVCHIREVIRRALELGSAAIIVVHNHPSGDPKPSPADIDITRKLSEAGKRLGVTLHDHVIMATGGYCSLRSMGLL